MTAKISRRHNTALRPGNVGNRHAGGKKEEEQDACGVDYGGGESHVSGSIWEASGEDREKVYNSTCRKKAGVIFKWEEAGVKDVRRWCQFS